MWSHWKTERIQDPRTGIEMAKRLPTHPVHDKLQERTKTDSKDLTKYLQRARPEILIPNSSCHEMLSPRVWLPRQPILKPRTVYQDLSKTEEQLPHQQTALITLEMLSMRYPQKNWIHAYTNGSAENAVRKGGSSVYIRNKGNMLYN